MLVRIVAAIVAFIIVKFIASFIFVSWIAFLCAVVAALVVFASRGEQHA